MYLRVFLIKHLFSVVYCRVFSSLSCIFVYYPINYRVCSLVYYMVHDTQRFRVLKVKLYSTLLFTEQGWQHVLTAQKARITA